MDFVFRRENPQ